MGHAMVQHIIKAGYEVYVWNRTKSKTDDLVSLWAEYCESIWDLTQKSDIIFSIIWDPKNVEETYFGENNILENLSEWKILIDMTTTKTFSCSKNIQWSKEKMSRESWCACFWRRCMSDKRNTLYYDMRRCRRFYTGFCYILNDGENYYIYWWSWNWTAY